MKFKNKIVLNLLLFVVGLLLVAWIIERVGWNNLLGAINNATLFWILAGIIMYFTCLTVRALKWYYLLGLLNHRIRFRYFIAIYFINSLAGILTPSKSGEAIFPFLLKRYLNLSVGKGFSIIYIDRLFELTVFIILMCISTGFILVSFNPPVILFNLLTVSLIVLIVFAGILTALFCLKSKIEIFCKYLEQVVENRAKFNFFRLVLWKIRQELLSFGSGLVTFNQRNVFEKIIFLTLCAWALEMYCYFLIARSLIDISFFYFAPCYIISAGVAIASFIPTGIGSGTISLVYLLALMEYSKAEAAAISLMGLVVPLVSLCFVSLFSYVMLERLGLKN